MSASSPDLTDLYPALAEGLPPARARVSLIIEARGQVTAATLEQGPGLVLGRSEPSDVVVADRGLSRTHARFVLRDGVVHVQDLGSTNGMRLGGERVQTCVLDDADCVELGSVRVTVSGLARAPEHAPLGGFSRFREAVTAEIARARSFARPFSVLAVRSAGAGGGLVERLAPLLRSVDVATAYTPELVLALLPEMPGELSAELGRKLIARLGVPAAAALASHPEDAADVEGLIEAAVHAVLATPAGGVGRAPHVSTGVNTSEPVMVSEAMKRVVGLVDKLGRANLPVLLLGEPGVGKELVARAVHERSARAQGPFVSLHCAGVAPDRMEGTLLGHEKVGGTERRAGVFEQARGGTVFLDEVGELSLAMQAAVLRVLETGRLSRVGGKRDIEVDVRLIAASCRDLSRMVSTGQFREDLLFRLDALSVRVPPLRERVEDIEPLAERFLAGARAAWQVPARGVSAEARARLVRHGWPGNVRQLKNVIERAALVCSEDTLGIDDLPQAVVEGSTAESTPAPRVPMVQRAFGPLVEHDAALSLTDRVAAFETRVIREALAKTAGNQAEAAALLKIPRRTLRDKIRTLGISSADPTRRG